MEYVPWASSDAIRKTMVGNKRRDTIPELAVRRLLHARGLRYRVDLAPLKGYRRRADVVFTRSKVAVFIDGCFWHGCAIHYRVPGTNAGYWEPKIARNVERDAETTVALIAAGWRVLRYWEHQKPVDIVEDIVRELGQHPRQRTLGRMIAGFEELDFQQTPMGELTLRRRVEPSTGVEVFEVKLGEEFLMSSLFVVAEEELARLGLAAHDDPRDVMVGGLGLGYTAVAALADPRVTLLTVVETMPAVIDWHERKLLPASTALVDDSRTVLQLADFFALMRAEPERMWDAILVDIDHSTQHQLDPSHADLYTVEGLRSLARHLRPGGVFALWSDDPPEPGFVAHLSEVFASVESHIVPFDNFLTGGVSTNTVYVARL